MIQVPGDINMKRLLTLLLVLAPVCVAAEPASNIAWTPEQLRFVKNGDLQKGKELAATCAGCHGEQGVSQVPNFPSLAGQLATYTYKQMRDYADNKRSNPLMNSVATSLSEQDSANLAVWFASLAAPEYKGKKQDIPALAGHTCARRTTS